MFMNIYLCTSMIHKKRYFERMISFVNESVISDY